MSTSAEIKLVQKMFADPVFESALSGVAGAVAVSSETTDAILELPDAALGRALKDRINLFRSLKSTLFSETAEPPAGDAEKLSRRVPLAIPEKRKSSGRIDMPALHGQALSERQRMVEAGHLLDTAKMVEESGVVRQTLTKAVDTGRMFTVTVGSKTYYPAFFARSKVDRKVLGKVTRALKDLPGWLKLDFFESANAQLGDLSPLEALAKGRVEEVLSLAQAYGDEAHDAPATSSRANKRAKAAA